MSRRTKAARAHRRATATSNNRAANQDDEQAATSKKGTKKKKSNIVNRPKDRPTDWQAIEGIFDSRVYWDFAARIPAQAREGKRRKLPTIFYVAMPALAAVWLSFDNTEVQLRDAETWARVCRIACQNQAKYAPAEEPFNQAALSATAPITAQNFRDARATWLAPHWHLLRDLFKTAAIDAAKEIGYCDPAGPGTINDLRREKVLVGDGKVTAEYAATYRPLTEEEREAHDVKGEMSHVIDKTTGDIIPVALMGGSANIYKDGTGKIVIGFKTARISVRDNVHSNGTIILDVAADTDRKEAQLSVNMFCQAKTALPGALAVVYDTALRGTHIAQLARRGLVSIAPITAKANPGSGKNSSKRVEKKAGLGSYGHQISDGSMCVHEFAHRGGQVCEIITDASGTKELKSLKDPALELRPGKGADRIYVRFDVTCGRHNATDGQTYTFPIRWNIAAAQEQEAGGRELNVAENIRAIPPGGDKYKAYYGWRQTVENDNHQSDGHKYLRRGRAKTAEHNLINEIGFAMYVNGIAVQNARARRASTSRTAAASIDTTPLAPPGLAAAA